MSRKRLVIITGLSGSGKTSAARALEDEGFFVVDNLPLALLPGFLDLADRKNSRTGNVAVVIDVRNREFLSDLDASLQQIDSEEFGVEVYFLESTDESLIRRYSETRRRHPLSDEMSVPEAIVEERRMLGPLREKATMIIDSSGLTPHQLRARFLQIVKGEEGTVPLVVRLQSFGYRYGIPIESDLVIDVRFLPNPHFDPNLRPLTGLNRSVREYVNSHEACREFRERFDKLLGFLIPQYQGEGKSYLTLSVGCTGGRHRSVSIVEDLRSFFSGLNVSLDIIHRDIDKS
ncbi:MAG: RNase adapter RapZ [Desulfuromonadales bacterium]|nr:RNase adapter RapZ [Desulfuromonadales bacterium]NIR34272.1 RNase adapter RapZ [Desulfuromonadales bacterium]NIS42850.1 RNase adapter RapZ [Desulfuromonadales bacterium]